MHLIEYKYTDTEKTCTCINNFSKNKIQNISIHTFIQTILMNIQIS